MENNNLEYSRRRPLPLELLVEMHKCLPLADAINVLVNVPSFAFVDINKPRMLRTIQQLKTSLKEHIDTLVEADEDESDDEENDPEELWIYNEIKWKPELDAFLLYGSWLTPTRKLYIHDIGGIPENFVQKLLLHLANSISTKMMLQIADIDFPFGAYPPTPTFLEPLFNEKQFRVGNRFVFESVELNAENGQTIYIHDGEYKKYISFVELRLFVQNKMNGNEWFKITIGFDSSKEFIRRLKFEQWKMQSSEDVKKFIQVDDNSFEEKDGNILEAKTNISYNPNLDSFLRRGARFTQFRHLKLKHQNPPYTLLDLLDNFPEDYADFLIKFVSNAKHPEEFLESIDLDLFTECSSSFKNLWKICQKGIPKGGKFVNFDKKKLHILTAKRIWWKLKDYKLEFTLANLPSNGKYLFDICVKFGNGRKHIFGIKIQKRKVANTVELKCDDQIEKKQLGKKSSNDDND